MGRHQQRGVDVIAVPPVGAVPPVRLAGQALGQLVGHPLGHLAGIDEDERGAVVLGVCGDLVQDVAELSPTGHRFELGVGELDRHIEIAGVAAVDDHRRRPVVVHAREQAGHHVERALRGREADALEVAAGLGDQRIQSLEAEGQMAPPLVAGQRVHLVHDDGVHAAQHGPRGRCGEEQVQRFGCGDEQVGRVLPHGRPLGRRRVTGADGHPQFGIDVSQAGGDVPDLAQRDVQVLVHVDGQGPQRGDVEDARRTIRRPAPLRPGLGGLGGPVGGVDRYQEPGQGLSRSGGRGHQDVAPRRDVGPGRGLGCRRPFREAPGEPLGHRRVELQWRRQQISHVPI